MPPLTALRAFEVAGRLGGFAPAALELGVTPGAVTAHLKTLESAIGAPLFERKHRGVELTELGARVLPEFTQAFRDLERAVHQLETQAAPDIVRFAAPPELAQFWLLPRFRLIRHAGLRTQLLTVDSPDAARTLADVGVFFEPAAPPDLMPVELIAVVSPERSYRYGSPQDLTADDCLAVQGAFGDWARWADAAGVPELRPSSPAREDLGLALSEAAYGRGVLVIAEPLAREMITGGRLEQLFDVSAPATVGVAISALHDVPPGSAIEEALKGLLASK